MMVKPDYVANSEFMSGIWDDLVADYTFRKSDAPALSALCLAYDELRVASESLTKNGKTEVIWNDGGVPAARPEIAIMERANAQVAALRKQLGIHERKVEKKATVSKLDAMKANMKVAR